MRVTLAVVSAVHWLAAGLYGHDPSGIVAIADDMPRRRATSRRDRYDLPGYVLCPLDEYGFKLTSFTGGSGFPPFGIISFTYYRYRIVFV